jgi:carbon-monoxide dehydrogenase small subunit
MERQRKITLRVNGVDYTREVECRRLLSDFIREELGLTGTHVGCEHGQCGSCTVLVNGVAIKSCLMLAVQARGAELLTVEGLATDGKLHPLQEAFWENHGLQCGFCTPGMLMSSLSLLQTNSHPTEEEIRLAIAGNLCRCTGYVNIVKSIQAAAEKMAESRVRDSSK